MAVELIAYAAPVEGGAALVAPANALSALASAGRVLSERPQAARLVVLTPDGKMPPESVARAFFRRAATLASLPHSFDPPGPAGRWHAALMAFGGLLLLAAGGSAAAAVGGLWLVGGYPPLRRAYLRRRAAAQTRVAAGLVPVLATSALEAHQHSGLAALSAIVGGDAGSISQRYRQAASACEALGLSPLAEFYDALARGAQPPVPWGAVLVAAFENDPSAAPDSEEEHSHGAV